LSDGITIQLQTKPQSHRNKKPHGTTKTDIKNNGTEEGKGERGGEGSEGGELTQTMYANVNKRIIF
jgi:hypothetical protein